MATKLKSKAFISEEIELLQELVLKYKSILTKKKSDASSVASKQKAWIVVEKEFNAQCIFVNRTAEQLKKRWDNMLQSRKKEIAEEKQQRWKTGGGQTTTITEQSSIDELINEKVDIEILDVPDCDASSDKSNDLFSEDMSPTLIASSNVTKIVKEPKSKDFLNDRKVAVLDKEASLRIKRLELLINQDENLYQLTKKKKELKIKIAETKIKILEKELYNEN